MQLAGIATGMADDRPGAVPVGRRRRGGFDFGLPAWGIFLQPLGFILFFAAAFAETKRAPFDVPEGESEIIGYFVEYSGMKFGLFMIAEFVEVVVLSGVDRGALLRRLPPALRRASGCASQLCCRSTAGCAARCWARCSG